MGPAGFSPDREKLFKVNLFKDFGGRAEYSRQLILRGQQSLRFDLRAFCKHLMQNLMQIFRTPMSEEIGWRTISAQRAGGTDIG